MKEQYDDSLDFEQRQEATTLVYFYDLDLNPSLSGTYLHNGLRPGVLVISYPPTFKKDKLHFIDVQIKLNKKTALWASISYLLDDILWYPTKDNFQFIKIRSNRYRDKPLSIRIKVVKIPFVVEEKPLRNSQDLVWCRTCNDKAAWECSEEGHDVFFIPASAIDYIEKRVFNKE